MRRFLAGGLLLGLTTVSAAQTAPRLELQNSGTQARLQAISIVSPEVVWVSGTGGTFAKTEDGGATWEAHVVPGADSLEFRDVHAFDARRAVLLAAGPGDKSRLYRTEDGGRSWILVFTNREPKAFYDCIDFAGSFGVAVSDEVGGRFPLLRTRNGGRSWEPFDPPGYDAFRALPGEGAFAASGTCIVVAEDGGFWLGTALGGRVIRATQRRVEVAETPVIHGPSAGIASLAFRSQKIGVAAGGDLGKQDVYTDNVAITRDGGETWRKGGRPSFPGPVYGLAYGPGPVLVAVGPRGASWSHDDGATWRRLDEAEYWAAGFSPRGVGWMVGPSGRIVRMTLARP